MKYRVIVADPPWPIKWTGGARQRRNGRGEKHENSKSSVRSLPYAAMTVGDICALGVADVSHGDAWLLLWVVDRFAFDGSAAAVSRAWGFEPRRFLVWEKSGMSLGSFPRPQHELCLVCTRGKPLHFRRNIASVQSWPFAYEKAGRSHARKHSAKPAGFFDLVSTTLQGPYLELFARETRDGWDGWGDQFPGPKAVEL